MRTTLEISTGNVRFPVAPDLYGLFFEDINRAADGGLYPEMIRNRAFEDSIAPAGCEISESKRIILNDGGWPGSFMNGEGMDDWAKKVAPTEIPGWYHVHADMQLDTKDVLNVHRLAALSVRFDPNGYIYNIGYDGISVKEKETYRFYMMVKAEKACRITAGFYNASGEVLGYEVLAVKPDDQYQMYHCKLAATDSGDQVCFRLTCDTEVSMHIGFTSLMPEKTFMGHGLREDLALALKDTHASFIRFPGGCVVEGINEQNAISFSRTIGPEWERPSSYLMWHYRTTNGLGYHEYLQLCEDLGMQAMYVCNCGMSCQARHGGGFDEETVQAYLMEALHALEYALGDVDTKYGAMRAANGHPQKFPLTYLEIGNENFGAEYETRYQKFYQTLKEAYPEVIYIANCHVEREGLETEIVDEHYYNTPEYFMENDHLFDNYDRKGPEIFIGEYAVNGGNTIGSMECALAEAVFLTGVEKNQDIVKLSAYAPLFQNANYTAWLPNLIVFNQTQVYGIPSYHVISLMGKYRGDQVVTSRLTGKMVPPHYVGIPGIMSEKEGVYFKNTTLNGKPVAISREVYGEAVLENGCYQLVNGTKRHRYTGKNEEWNVAFEKFIGAGPDVDNPVFWVVFGDDDMEEYTFEADIKFEKDHPVTLSIWNYYPNTDVGCNEPRDTGWNIRSVRNQIWKLHDGKSMLRSPRFFDLPLTPDEVVQTDIDYMQFNHYKIVAGHGRYQCYINDRLIQEKKLMLHSLVSEVVTVDEQHIYVKLVNVDQQACPVDIRLDCDVESVYTIEYVEGEPQAVNTFNHPEHVVAKREIRDGAGRAFEFILPASSICVLVLKKQSES